MKKLNKALALGMAGAMALGLTACGGGSSSSAATGDTASTEGVTTLTWVTVGNGQPANSDAWLAQINPYLEEKIGVNLDVQVVSWGDWDNRRNVIVNTSGEYDILFTNMNTYVNDINIGAFYDISELVKTATADLASDDDYRIKAATERLTNESQKIFAKIYQQAAGAQGAGPEQGGADGTGDTEFHQ